MSKHELRLEKQRERRHLTRNWDIKKYEKTIKGFLVRLYRNMKSRIEGVQKHKFHLYEGKELLAKEEFYQWSLGRQEFYKLFGDYKEKGFPRTLAPSVDRVDSSKGYSIDNMEWVTMLENSKRGNISRHSKSTSNS